jgi:predicted metalloendopeptidase
VRYVLINDFETSLANTAKRVKAEQMDFYISKDKDDISACLVVAIEDYCAFPDAAYKESNISEDNSGCCKQQFHKVYS